MIVKMDPPHGKHLPIFTRKIAVPPAYLSDVSSTHLNMIPLNPLWNNIGSLTASKEELTVADITKALVDEEAY